MATHDNMALNLNNHHFRELNDNLQNLISFLDNTACQTNPLIQCTVIEDNLTKPNINITINQNNYYISVLSGHGCSVHEEQAYDFINYITQQNAPPNVIDFINTLCNGTEHTTDCVQHADAQTVNDVRNFFYSIRTNLIQRSLQTGIYNRQRSEYVYWGDVNWGYIRTMDYVITQLSNSTANTNIIPVGGLILQRKNRTVNNNIQIKWPYPEEVLR